MQSPALSLLKTVLYRGFIYSYPVYSPMAVNLLSPGLYKEIRDEEETPGNPLRKGIEVIHENGSLDIIGCNKSVVSCSQNYNERKELSGALSYLSGALKEYRSFANRDEVDKITKKVRKYELSGDIDSLEKVALNIMRMNKNHYKSVEIAKKEEKASDLFKLFYYQPQTHKDFASLLNSHSDLKETPCESKNGSISKIVLDSFRGLS